MVLWQAAIMKLAATAMKKGELTSTRLLPTDHLT
jgi:hypothetical protein